MHATKIIAEIIKRASGNLYVYPGGTIAPLLHECKKDNIKLIVSKHEQGAGYMAIAEAQLYHEPSFVAVTSGPGATNIITPLADAYYDSVPLIVLTGQVGTADLSRSSKIRQRGFQEVPIIQMVSKVTKKVFQPKSIEELSEAIQIGYFIANSQRKGPVLIDLPMDIQLKEIKSNDLERLLNMPKFNIKQQAVQVDTKTINNIVHIINNSKKPLILIGGGAQEKWKKVRDFTDSVHIPVISSLRGLGIVVGENFKGWIGHTGTPWGNKILYESDTVIVLGSRLDIRQTGSETWILDNKNIIHIDIDENELNECRIKNTIKIHIDIVDFITMIESKINKLNIDEWIEEIDKIKEEYNFNDNGTSAGINPSEILDIINNKIMKSNKITYFVTGVGSHQQWVARYIHFDNNKIKLFTSAGHGTMGFALPTAIGLQNLDKNSQVICVDGDGSFQLNIQELALIKELKLNLKILILDNNRLGIVSQFQKITFGDDPTTGDFKNPDFVAIAKAYGIQSYFIDNIDETVINNWILSEKPSLLHMQIKHEAPVSPMLLGGQKLNEMWRVDGE